MEYISLSWSDIPFWYFQALIMTETTSESYLQMYEEVGVALSEAANDKSCVIAVMTGNEN